MEMCLVELLHKNGALMVCNLQMEATLKFLINIYKTDQDFNTVVIQKISVPKFYVKW